MNIFVVNLRYNSELEVIRVDRSTPLGNPFKIGKDGNRSACIAKYRGWLWKEIQKSPDESPASRMFHELVGLAIIREELLLGCWCTPESCHAEVIAKAIDWKVRG